MYNRNYLNCPFIFTAENNPGFYYCRLDNEPCNKNCMIHLTPMHCIDGTRDELKFCYSASELYGTCRKSGKPCDCKCDDHYTLLPSGWIDSKEKARTEPPATFCLF